MRELADMLGLSHATVSAGLRGSPNVKASTRARIVEVAQRMGYRANPLASALMAEMRRSRGAVFRGLLAILRQDGDEARRDATSVRREWAMSEGAIKRAAELGFVAEVITLGQAGFTRERLREILHTRGVRGVLLLPSFDFQGCGDIDWSGFAGVHAGRPGVGSLFDSVYTNHFRAIELALERASACGYRRPGLALVSSGMEYDQMRWKAACYGLAREECAVWTAPMEGDAAAGFAGWFKRGGYDAILADDVRVFDWMRMAEAEIPGRHGFCLLGAEVGDGAPAGVDLSPRDIGGRAMEFLTAQMMRNEADAPAGGMDMLLTPRWIEGRSFQRITVTGS